MSETRRKSVGSNHLATRVATMVPKAAAASHGKGVCNESFSEPFDSEKEISWSIGCSPPQVEGTRDIGTTNFRRDQGSRSVETKHHELKCFAGALQLLEEVDRANVGAKAGIERLFRRVDGCTDAVDAPEEDVRHPRSVYFSRSNRA